MKHNYKSKITLNFDADELKVAMVTFFGQYKKELPLFLRDALTALGITSDPKMVIKKDEIMFSKIDNDKGRVFVWKDKNLVLTTYRLVPNDEKYLHYENGALIVYFKRKEADTQAGMFPDFSMAYKGFKDVKDPAILLAEAEKEKSLNEIPEIIENPKMEVTK